MALCRLCDEQAWRRLGYVKIVLLSPDGSDERERIIWRSRAKLQNAWERRNHGFGGFEGLDVADIRTEPDLFVTATPEMWRKMR